MAFNISYNFTALDKFSGPVKKINRSTRKVQKRMKSLNKTLDKTEKKFSNLTKRMNKFGNKLKGALTVAGIFLAFKKIVSVGSEFQSSMADLQAITGAVGDELNFLAKSSKNMSVKFAQSSSKIAEAFTLVASKKPELLKNTEALVEMTEKVLLLQAASGIDLSDAAIITSETLNIFGKSARDAGKFVDILAAGAKFGSSFIGQTGAAARIAAPQFSKLGLSFIDLNAAIQTVALGGFTAERAGTALNAIFQRLSKSGIDFQKTGLVKGLELVKFELDKVTDNTKRAVLESKIFGEEHGKVAIPLLNNIALLRKFQKSLNTAGIAQEQANIRLKTFSTRIKRIGIEIQNKLIETFLRLEPKLIQMTQSFKGFLDSIGTEEIDALVEGLNAVLVVTIGILKAITAVTRVFGELQRAKSIKNPIPERSGLFGVFGKKLTETQPQPITPLQSISMDRSSSDINVNINAPEGVVRSVTAKSKGPTNFNLGQNGGLSAVGAF
jgi:TP901 family phage tail tape measure protein